MRILVDADACPVKDEIYRVARRLETPVTVVANSWMRIPHDPGVDLVVVGNELDAADDWIAEHAGNRDIVVTADIPLAARCLEKGARVVGPKGRPFTTDSIGEALASRELLSQLREMGIASEGPPPFQKRDRSSFLHKLDEMIRAIRREAESS